MDLLRKLGMTWEEAALTVITAIGVYVAIIVFSRLFGQRQFANVSTYDMAFTSRWGPWRDGCSSCRRPCSTPCWGWR